ncbi:VOC family protein [Ancylobacter lacus]|uniref:VOC family protein n=1 Tax=Ancylobacter lacus TaxID=2579970 RepID=UPI001BCFA35C|nr:VOC family protein [Ancylobacter lacus]MBS7539478.1 VOC family protein [Ancylobacter lacus]
MSLILYTTLGVADLARATTFYDALLAPLGHARRGDAVPGFEGYGADYDDGVSLWLCQPFDGGAPSGGNGTMVAFRAPDSAAVDAFHRTALALGGRDEGAPGLRPHYGPGFYAAYVRDPDGNKLACVFHRHGES